MAVVTERVQNGYKLGTSGGMLLGKTKVFRLNDSILINLFTKLLL
jgi:hypothetical protein